jgi:hypothetical protein
MDDVKQRELFLKGIAEIRKSLPEGVVAEAAIQVEEAEVSSQTDLLKMKLRIPSLEQPWFLNANLKFQFIHYRCS